MGKVEYFNQINEFKVLTPTLTTSELDCQFEEYIKPKIYNLVRNLKGCCSWLQEGPNTSKTNLIFFFTTSEHGIESHSMGKKLFFLLPPVLYSVCLQSYPSFYIHILKSFSSFWTKKVWLKAIKRFVSFTPSFIYSWSMSHILEHDFSYLDCLGSQVSDQKSSILLKYSTFDSFIHKISKKNIL